jgi:hypothetical protein
MERRKTVIGLQSATYVAKLWNRAFRDWLQAESLTMWQGAKK